MRIFVSLLVVFLLLSYGRASAQAPSPSFIPASGVITSPAGTCNFVTGKLSFDCVPVYIGFLIKLLLGFAAGFALTGIILSGYRIAIGSVTAEGKEGGKKELLATLMGLAVILLSYLLVDTVIEALT
ncbi:MAG: hypothetical protein AAB853_05815 [Patescibacteria group bacterium]